jgi:hypothetical protein
MSELEQKIKESRADRQCKGDDCECHHCPKCHGHTLGWLDTFQMCTSCQLEEEGLMLEASDRAEANRETPIGEQLDGFGEHD